MRFVASGYPVDPDNLLADTPLVGLQIGGGEHVKYVPALNEHPERHRLVSFGEWWERNLIFRSGDNARRLTRKKLAFALRNMDGGSHFDDVVQDPNYIEMTHGKTWISELNGEKKFVRELELASMRQVAWELIDSLRTARVG